MVSQKQKIVDAILGNISLTKSAVERARDRYKDIGNWINRDDSLLKEYSPHIYSQGSFRLGTAIRPTNETDSYDLDFSLKLREGITRDTHTQEQVKELVRNELEAYRIARQIQNDLEQKHRCWRLEYQDSLAFHLDIVPSIPVDYYEKQTIQEAIIQFNESDENLSNTISEEAVFITDDRLEGYSEISDNWKGSNPEGFATWFESKIYPTKILLAEAKIDKIPTYDTLDPIQIAISILKRHRDIMFQKHPDLKPISIIITTLAARSYNGEKDVHVLIVNILKKMRSFINSNTPRIPNPVDPREDFADRWIKDSCLEGNFYNWIEQASKAFDEIFNAHDEKSLTHSLDKHLKVALSTETIKELFPKSSQSVPFVAVKKTSITEPPKPWKQHS